MNYFGCIIKHRLHLNLPMILVQHSNMKLWLTVCGCFSTASGYGRHPTPRRLGIGCQVSDGCLVESDGLSPPIGQQERRRYSDSDEQTILESSGIDTGRTVQLQVYNNYIRQRQNAMSEKRLNRQYRQIFLISHYIAVVCLALYLCLYI